MMGSNSIDQYFVWPKQVYHDDHPIAAVSNKTSALEDLPAETESLDFSV